MNSRRFIMRNSHPPALQIPSLPGLKTSILTGGRAGGKSCGPTHAPDAPSNNQVTAPGSVGKPVKSGRRPGGRRAIRYALEASVEPRGSCGSLPSFSAAARRPDAPGLQPPQGIPACAGMTATAWGNDGCTAWEAWQSSVERVGPTPCRRASESPSSRSRAGGRRRGRRPGGRRRTTWSSRDGRGRR
jgi:hypothetical protein